MFGFFRDDSVSGKGVRVCLWELVGHDYAGSLTISSHYTVRFTQFHFSLVKQHWPNTMNSLYKN